MRVIASVRLSKFLSDFLVSQPETGMGYQICTVELVDGRKFPGVTIQNCEFITRVAGERSIPFTGRDIKKVIVTHDKSLTRNI